MSSPSLEKITRITPGQRESIASSHDDNGSYSSNDVAEWTEQVEAKWEKN